MDTQKLDQTYIANTYARFPVTIVKGKGSLVWDDTGKEYIDLSTGIAVDIFGVADQAARHAPAYFESLLYGAMRKACADALRKDRHEEGLLRQFRRGGERVRHQGRPEVVGGEKGQGLFHHHHPEKQLPWPHDHHPGRDRSGRVPPRFYPPDRGLCLCRAERSG